VPYPAVVAFVLMMLPALSKVITLVFVRLLSLLTVTVMGAESLPL